MNTLFLGFYLGVFSVILLFNFLWYIYNREKAYLYYVFLHINLLILTLIDFKIINFSSSLIAIITIFFAYAFTKEFLNLEKYYENINKKFSFVSISFIMFLFLLFISGNKHLLLYIPYSIFFFGFVFLAFLVYKKGFILAKYYLIAWGLNTITILFGDIQRIFNYEIFHFDYLSQVGNILEAIILAIALLAKTKMINDEKKEKEEMLIHQSRLASMGEMLANISHQWRQPLNRIASFIVNMQIHIMDNYEKEKYLLKKLEESQTQLEYMSSTIDDFTNFYKKDKKKELFKASSAIKNAISIIADSLRVKKIELILEIKEDFELNSYPKELAQVILNLIQNAKDAIIQNDIKEGKIQITIEKNKILVSDNAKGIKKDILNKIFEPYFTTKEAHKGTGLGLYMSKIILEQNMKAKINIETSKDGSIFILCFK